MANLDETFKKPEFDWSAISVGDYKLDHSQNFFANKENNSNLSNENCPQLFLSNCSTPQAEAINRSKQEKEEEQSKLASASPVQLEQLRKTKDINEDDIKTELAATAPAPVQHASPLKVTKDENATNVAQKAIIEMESTEEQPKLAAVAAASPLMDDDIENLPKADTKVAAPSNLRMQWSPIPHKAPATVATPNAYAFKDVYECNRKQAMRRQEEEDRQARQFHSRPMPNFKALHKRIDDMVVVHRITVPETPETVKYWKMCVDRRRQAKRDQDEAEQKQQQKDQKTFNLRCEQRVRNRRDFDSAVQVRQDQKKKEVNQLRLIA